MQSKNRVGAWIEHSGQLLLFLVFVVCMFDLYGFTERGGLLVPLSGYLSLIFSGVVLHIVAAPIKQIDFHSQIKQKSVK